MTEESSFRGHSKAHSLQGTSKALLGHQLQGAEVAGASEEDMGISPGKCIAYSVVKTRATLQEHAILSFRNKKRLPKQKLGRTSRSRFYTLLRATPPTYQNMWAINLQLLLLWQASHKLPLPPPLPPTHTQSQQPEGRQHPQQQRDFREESKARIVNNTVPESKYIY
jgi:hypothetical protein